MLDPIKTPIAFAEPPITRYTDNPFLDQVHAVLPRILASFDTDPLSPNFGMGDRYHWAWKCIDFGNGTFQGIAHGLARLLVYDLLPDWLGEAAVLRRIEAMFLGADRLRRSDGSLEEAFPFEGSYCVTALVAYDLLSAIQLLDDRIPNATRVRFLEVVRPMVGFLCRADETHALISNHLATAAAALVKWHALTGEAGEQRAFDLLDIIRTAMSPEGWFREYEGADPGYQTLCTYYLADIHRMRPDLGLIDSLRTSVRFLWHFAHPDGSFGGNYGSRNTRFYFPAGIAALAGEVPEAATLTEFMAQSIRAHRTVTLETLDASGIVPMFNAYCWAAAERFLRDQSEAEGPTLPAMTRACWRQVFPEAGLLVDSGPEHYSIVSWKKGGVVYHFPCVGAALLDTGCAYKTEHQEIYSTQGYDAANAISIGDDKVTVTSPLTAVHHQMPTPWKFLVLRALNVTLMRWRPLREFIKRAMVKYLITGKSRSVGRIERMIHLGPELHVVDKLHEPRLPLVKVEMSSPFKAIHMASSGYWQKQDDAA